MLRHLIIATLCLFALPACKTVRTVYDINGNEVKEHAGGERSLEDYMSETFDKEVSRKKNEEGVPESSSNKVSRYQRDIDAARKSDKTFITGAFSGTGSYSGADRNFSGAGKKFDTGKPYGGTYNSAYSTDLRPDFMSDTKGIYSRDDAYGVSSADRAAQDGQPYDDFSPTHTYGTGYSEDISREDTSGYFESRKDKFGKPRIISHQDYYRKTITETRSMLGRDEEPTEE